MANTHLKKLEQLKRKGQIAVFNPSKGLMSVLTESKELYSDSKKIQSNTLLEITESHKDSFTTLEKIDYGIGKVVKVIQEAFTKNEPPPIPGEGGNVAKTMAQATLDFFQLWDMKTDDELNLQRGILANVTGIRTIMNNAAEALEREEDKKRLKIPEKKDKKDKPTVKDGAMGWLKEAMKWMGKLLMAPFAFVAGAVWAFLKENWEKMINKINSFIDEAVLTARKWWDDAIIRGKDFIKTSWDDFTRWFSGKFPKTATFIDDVTTKLATFLDDVFKTLPDWMQKLAPKVLPFFGDFIGTVLRTGAKLLGKLALPASLIYDFFTGWFNAAEITQEQTIGLKEKVLASLSKMISGLFTMGFIPAEDFYQVIFGDFGLVDIIGGWFKSIWGMMPDQIKGIGEQIGGLFTLGGETLSEIFDQFGLNMNIAGKLEKLLDEIAEWTDKKISFKNLAPSWMGGGDPEAEALEKKNKEFTRVQNAKAIPRPMDTSSAHLSDKKAKMEANKNAKPIMVQTPPATVITTGQPTLINMFEADLQSMLTGR